MTPHAATQLGRRVLLTRSEEDCAEWAERLARHGADSVALPCIRCEPIATPASKAALAAAVPSSDWLVFTSRRGVEAFAALDPPTLPARCRVAVVGGATAEAARSELGRVDVVGAGTAAALGATLADLGELTLHRRVLLAVAETSVGAEQLIMPHFVLPAKRANEPISSMPGIAQQGLENVVKQIGLTIPPNVLVRAGTVIK